MAHRVCKWMRLPPPPALRQQPSRCAGLLSLLLAAPASLLTASYDGQKTAADKPPGEGSVRSYLDATVVPVLMAGLSDLVRVKPADPCQHLADCESTWTGCCSVFSLVLRRGLCRPGQKQPSEEAGRAPMTSALGPWRAACGSRDGQCSQERSSTETNRVSLRGCSMLPTGLWRAAWVSRDMQ